MIERKEREKEGCRSTRPPPSEGIETDSSLDRRPIPPSWRRVVPGADALATRIDPPHGQNLNVVPKDEPMRVARPLIYSDTQGPHASSHLA